MLLNAPTSTFLVALGATGAASADDPAAGSVAPYSASALCTHDRCVSSRLITYW